MNKRQFWFPLIAAVVIVIVDQIVKALVVAHIPEGRISVRILGDFIWIVHARNTGAAFSLGASSAPLLRLLFFIVLPLVVLSGVMFYYVRGRGLTSLLRWAMGLILGGGVGNLIDRIFRPEGVVDFVSLNMYGLFGMERFATFNIADSAITIGEILLVVGLLIVDLRRSRLLRGPEGGKNKNEQDIGQ